jgi:hypothetical protein
MNRIKYLFVKIFLAFIAALLVSSAAVATDEGGAGIPSEPGLPAEPTGEAHGAKKPGIAPQPRERPQESQLYLDDKQMGFGEEAEESKSEFFGVSGE